MTIDQKTLTAVETGGFGPARRSCTDAASGWAACLSRLAKTESPCKVQVEGGSSSKSFRVSVFCLNIRRVGIDLDRFIARQTVEPQQLLAQTSCIVLGIDRLNLRRHAVPLKADKFSVKEPNLALLGL